MSDLNEWASTYHQQYRDSGDTFYEDMGISPEVVDAFQLGKVVEPLDDSHKKVEGLDVVPYISAQGRVVQLRVSTFTFDKLVQPLNLVLESVWPMPRPHIFNVGHTLPGLRTSRVVVVHDVLSALLLRSEGYRTVALPGLEWRDPWMLLFQQSDVVHVTPDLEVYAEWPNMWRKARVRAQTVTIEAEFLHEMHDTVDTYEDIIGVKP